MEIIKSNKGGKKLCYNGYMYVTHKKSASRNLYWRCCRNGALKCKGALTTDFCLTSAKLTRMHNHPPDEDRVLLVKTVQEMKDKAKNTSLSTKQIYEEAAKALEARKLVPPSSESLMRTLRNLRTRTKSHLEALHNEVREAVAAADMIGISESESVDEAHLVVCKEEILDPEVRPLPSIDEVFNYPNLDYQPTYISHAGMERWHGRVALVTGASVGIGAGICEKLVKHGIKVVGCARDAHKIQEIAQTCPPGFLTAIRCDLRNESEILSMFKEIKERFGRLDICINNAGLSTQSPLISGNSEDFRTMLDVNVLALCICTQEAIKLMREKNIDDGQIIHINSAAAHRIPTLTNVNFYAGTKTMVKVLTEGLRRELRSVNSHIRVASISPGLVETEFMYRMMKDDPKKADQVYSSMKCLSAEDVAECVVSILQTPPHVDINDIFLRPIDEAH